MASRWEDLRREARQLENAIDAKLVSFSKLGTSHHDDRSNSSPARSCDAIAKEISQLMLRLASVNDAMNEVVHADAPSAMLHTLQRHHDILQDYKQEFNKTKANVNAFQEREDLIGSVRQDIHAHKTTAGSVSRRTELYMKENDGLLSSDRLADDALGAAMSAKESLASQRNLLSSISNQVTGLANRYPAINNLMTRINFRKRRDSIILGCVIAGCIILIFIYSQW